MKDSESKTFRAFLDQHLPGGTADMSEAEIAGMRQLVDMVGNPAAAAGLIAEIDALLAARDSQSDARLCDGSIGVKYESPEQARSFLRQFRSLLAGDWSPRSKEMVAPYDRPNDKEPGQSQAPITRPRRAARHRSS